MGPASQKLYEYVRCREETQIPDNAVRGGTDKFGDGCYFAKGTFSGKGIPGRVSCRSENLLLTFASIPSGGGVIKIPDFEVLTTKYPTSFIKCKPGDDVPDNAVQGGHDDGLSYHARALVEGLQQPGKVSTPTDASLKLECAYIPWNSKELLCREFEVLIISDPIDRVEFSVSKGQILKGAPKVLAVKTITNNSDTEQSVEFAFTETISQTSSYSKLKGVNIATGTTFSTGLPFIANGEISMELGLSHDQTWGKETTTEQSLASTFPVVAKPHTTVKCHAVVSEGKMEVPYTIILKSGQSSSGTWEGTSVWNLRADYETVTVN